MGYDLIKITKVLGAPGTSLTIAAADDPSLTPGPALQNAVAAISVTNTAAVTNCTVQDGATILMTLLPSPAGNSAYWSFGDPGLKITSGSNDLRLVVTGTSGTIRATVWFRQVM